MAERKLTPRGEFDKALAERAARFGVELDEETRARLGDYFELVAAWNPRLHLAAPCLVLLQDVKAVLVEASQKKSVFLHEALSRLGLSGRARVVAERFEKVEPPDADCLPSRAIE